MYVRTYVRMHVCMCIDMCILLIMIWSRLSETMKMMPNNASRVFLRKGLRKQIRLESVYSF